MLRRFQQAITYHARDMVAWSLGGPRSGGFAAQNPQKVNRLVLLAPAYRRDMPADAPKTQAEGPAFNTQSRADFDANWDRQVGCPGQYDPAAAESVQVRSVPASVA